MGGCLSFWHKPDLTGSTFSHYSLNSQSDALDLYPGFRYVESSISEDEQSTWRKSSAPLLNSWETIPSPQDTLSTSSSFSQSNRSRADAPGCKDGARVNHSCVHYFGWEMGIVKLRKTLKISPRIKPEEFDRESSDFEIEIRRSVRDSGETIMEDL